MPTEIHFKFQWVLQNHQISAIPFPPNYVYHTYRATFRPFSSACQMQPHSINVWNQPPSSVECNVFQVNHNHNSQLQGNLLTMNEKWSIGSKFALHTQHHSLFIYFIHTTQQCPLYQSNCPAWELSMSSSPKPKINNLNLTLSGVITY